MSGPSRGYYATDAQVHYIRILVREAFANRYTLPYVVDERTLHRMPKGEATKLLDHLLAAKRRGWTAEAKPADSTLYAHFESPDGSRGTCLARVWAFNKSKHPELMLVKTGPFDPTWRR